MTIKNGDIRASRGEDFRLQFNIREKGEPYKMQLGDRVHMIVKKIMTAEEPAVIDRMSVGSSVIHIKGSDTEKLMSRKYRYTVHLIKSDGSKHILVDTHNFEIAGGSI